MLQPTHHGVLESDSITPEQQAQVLGTQYTVAWNDPDLRSIDRLRLLSDPGCGWWDISYCVGTMKDGTQVDVELPCQQFSRKRGGPSVLRQLVDLGKKHGVYVKGLIASPDSVISMLV